MGTETAAKAKWNRTRVGLPDADPPASPDVFPWRPMVEPIFGRNPSPKGPSQSETFFRGPRQPRRVSRRVINMANELKSAALKYERRKARRRVQ
jgi:hypothetical protein